MFNFNKNILFSFLCLSYLYLSSKPNLWQLLQSVLGALFGVQSSKVAERDFTRGHPWWVYLGLGLLVIALLILLLVGLAKWILISHPSSGG